MWDAAAHPRGPDGRFISTGGAKRREVMDSLKRGDIQPHEAADRLAALAKEHEQAGPGGTRSLTARHLFSLAEKIRPAKRPLPTGTSVSAHSSGRLHVSTPYDKAFVGEVKALGGTWLPKSKTWSVPGDKADQLDALIRRTYEDAPTVRPSDLTPSTGLRVRTNGKFEVHTPYNADFVNEARTMGGSWDPSAKAWVFPGHREQQVKAAIAKHYGQAWRDRQKAATDARREIDSTRRAPGAAPATTAQKALIAKLTSGYDEADWHDATDSAYAMGSSDNPAPFLDSLTVAAASALLDDLIASKRGW
jgi:hypothetical protein